jgi:hypothetical protein
MFFFVCLQSILFWVSHDMCSTQGHQEKSITYDYVVHRDIEALDDIVSIDKITKGVDRFSK